MQAQAINITIWQDRVSLPIIKSILGGGGCVWVPAALFRAIVAVLPAKLLHTVDISPYRVLITAWWKGILPFIERALPLRSTPTLLAKLHKPVISPHLTDFLT
jgi:hypothetical protein